MTAYCRRRASFRRPERTPRLANASWAQFPLHAPPGALGTFHLSAAYGLNFMLVDLIRDKSTVFPDVGNFIGVTGLRVWHCKYKSLAPISRMKHLRALMIATYPDDTFETLSDLSELEWLSIVHLPKIASLDSLAFIKSLRWLELATLPSWDASRRRTTVRSLSPLAELPSLEHVSLLGVVPEDESLEPLRQIKSLKTAILHGLPKKETACFFEESSVQRQHIQRHELLPER